VSDAHDQLEGSDTTYRLRGAFERTWLLTTLVATALEVFGWYFGLTQIDVEQVLVLLALLTACQLALASRTRFASLPSLRAGVLASQLLGTALLGLVWHLTGGLQQPLFPVLIALPLMPAFFVLTLWQRFLTTVALVALLTTGLILAPESSNSFLVQRYGLHSFLPGRPHWLPASHVAFIDVNTTSPYELMLVTTLAVVAVSIGATAGVIADLSARARERVRNLSREVARLQDLNSELVAQAPSAEILASSATGKIIAASARFTREFALSDYSGKPLLDAAGFRYPDVIRRLLSAGGEDVQIVTIEGRETLMRIWAVVVAGKDESLTRLCFERSDELAWRGAANALEEPLFSISANGQVIFPNRAAVALFGVSLDGRMAESLFDGSTDRWWDISPLDNARRIVRNGQNRYVAAITRERLATTLNEVSIVRLMASKGLQAA
jgi:PAS domain-containing protein